jgi:hypothetical protein
MTKALALALLGVVRSDQPLMLGESRQRDLQRDLARPLRPAVCLLRVLEPLQLATDINQYPGDLCPTAMSARITLWRR